MKLSTIIRAIERPNFEAWFVLVLSAASISLAVSGCIERRAGDIAIGILTTCSCIFAVVVSVRGRS